jgi:Major Facilitator Superfamily
MEMIRQGLRLLTRSRDFALLMGVQFLAQAGDGIVQAALAKLIVFGGQKGFDVEGARSPDELLRIVLYVFVPYTLLSPFLGVVIDRWDRRRLLVLANGFRAAVVALVALAGTGRVPDVALFLAFLLTISTTRIVLATKAAALPVALDEQSLVEGNAVSQLGGAMFQLGGAGVALVATGVIDAGPVVFFGAIVYAAGAVLGLGLRHIGEPRSPLTFGQEIARVVHNIVGGIREVARTPKAGASITTYFWLRFLWSFSIVSIGFVARDLLADDDFAILLITGGSGAAGGALGFLLAGRMHARVRTTSHLVFGASLVAGGAVAVFGAIEFSAAIAVLAFFLGLGFFLAKISLDTLVQEALGDDFRGRAFSLYDIAYNLAWVLAAGILKIAWSPDVQGALIATIGVVFLLGMACIAMWFRGAGLFAIPAAVDTASR